MNDVRDDSLAAAYDSWHGVHSVQQSDPHTEAFYDWVLDVVDPASGARLLDVACGSGGFLRRAADRDLSVVGVDVSPVAIELAHERVPEADLHVGDAEELPFADSSFDVVTCLGSLEHFPSPEAGAAEIARVLAPDGRAILFVPNLFFLGHIWFGLRHGTQPSEGGQAFSETFRSSEGWRSLLETSGLRVERRHSWNKIHASAKVSHTTMRLWNAVSRFVPQHGAYAFAYVCRRGST